LKRLPPLFELELNIMSWRELTDEGQPSNIPVSYIEGCLDRRLTLNMILSYMASADPTDLSLSYLRVHVLHAWEASASNFRHTWTNVILRGKTPTSTVAVSTLNTQKISNLKAGTLYTPHPSRSPSAGSTITSLSERTALVLRILIPTVSDRVQPCHTNYDRDLGSSRRLEGRPKPPIPFSSLCSYMEPVFTPPTVRKGGILRLVTSLSEHRNRVIAPCLLHPLSLKGLGSTRDLSHSIDT